MPSRCHLVTSSDPASIGRSTDLKGEPSHRGPMEGNVNPLARKEWQRSQKSALAESAKVARAAEATEATEATAQRGCPDAQKNFPVPLKALPRHCSRRYFRIFTYQEHIDCFAPPLGDSTTPPNHWPEGFKVSSLPRVAWLPPGWGQAYRDDCDRKFYVAPETLGSRAMVNKLNVELAVGKKLKPADQHGFILGDEYIKKWPPWLPKDWRIAYFRSSGGSLKPCFLGPTGAQYNNKKEVLAKKKEEISNKRVGLKALASRPSGCTRQKTGRFAQRLAKTTRSRRKVRAKVKPPCFRTFTPQELADCFGPPLGDSLTPPSHWPKDLKVSRLPRISWLPPGWTQAYRDGMRRKLYVAPPELGSKVVFHRENVESIVGRRLHPIDQHGVLLGNECITHWPGWLPKDWRIGYYKVRDVRKVCFLNPKGDRFQDRKSVLDSLDPDRGKRKPTKLNVKRRRKPKKKPIKVDIGEFARRTAFRLRQRAIFSLRDLLKFQADEADEKDLPDTCDIFLSFTYEEFAECFAPPLGDITEPPAWWPEGLQELILQAKLRPLDQHGKLLGLGDECIERWPTWLPQTWRIAYYKVRGEIKPCFVSPSGVRCSKRSEVGSEVQKQKLIDQANAAEAERLSKCKRLRKVDTLEAETEVELENDLEQSEAVVPAEPAAINVLEKDAKDALESGANSGEAPRKRKRLRKAQIVPEEGDTVTAAPSALVRQPRTRRLLSAPSGLEISKLSDADREWLTNHPLYIKIQRGYPIPIGDQDILALRAFTPKEMGGDGDFTFY
eukprot:Skav208995  [mRNA]  locus=scaffold2686:135171:139560:- [translate_table: standard]